jgi:2-polyprenyl-3-methyl-5-hydroxy-6-metoxy-1,4-benzoquinol methylase
MKPKNYEEAQAKRFFGHDMEETKERLRQALTFFKPLLEENGSILDIGTRDGWFVEYLHNEKRYPCVLGIEITKEAVEYANRQGRKVIQGDAHNLSCLCLCKYSIVTMIHSLEHCYDPKKVIEEIWKVLSPEGMFFIEVPLESKAKIGMAHFCNFTNIGDIQNLLGEYFSLIKYEIYSARNNQKHLMCLFRREVPRLC